MIVTSRRAVGFSAAVLLASTAACGTTPTGASVTNVIIGTQAEPTHHPDPILDGSLPGYSFYYNLFDTLTRIDAAGKVKSSLATKWRSNGSFTDWTFTLRTDVKFTNGDRLTAHDVAFTFNQIMRTPDSQPLTYLAPLKSVEALDSTTVKFHLKESFSSFPSLVTAAAIVPEKVYRRLGSKGFSNAPVGSGPYKFVSHTRGVDYQLQRNEKYWGKKAPFERLTFQLVADEDARLNGVESGSLNVALIAPNQVDYLRDGTVDVQNVGSNGVTFLGLNSTKGPLKDPKVRRAIELAIDKKKIARAIFAGRAKVASQMIAPTVGGYDPSMKASGYDPAKAKKLLEGSSYDGKAIPLEYASNGRIPLSAELVQAIQQMLRKVGVRVDLKGMDQATLSDRIYTKKNMKGIYLNTYAPSQMDGDPVIEDFFSGGFNDYAMRKSTERMVSATRKVSGKERIAVYGKLMRYNAEHNLLIPLYVPEASFVSTTGMEWEPRTDGLFYFGAPIR